MIVIIEPKFSVGLLDDDFWLEDFEEDDCSDDQDVWIPVKLYVLISLYNAGCSFPSTSKRLYSV